MIYAPHTQKVLHSMFHRWCACLDTVTVAILSLAIGLLLGELVNSGWSVVVNMLSFFAASTIIMFSGLLLWGVRYDRRSLQRRQITAISGSMFAVVLLHMCSAMPWLAIQTIDLFVLVAVAVVSARYIERKCSYEHK